MLTPTALPTPYPDGTPGDPHDKLDVRPENLVALCQRCHLLEDLPLRIEKARRHARRLAAGQAELWEAANTEKELS